MLKTCAALGGLTLLVLLGARVPAAAAMPSLTCTGSNAGASGVLDIAVSSAGYTDSLTVAESGGNYSITATSGGSTSAVCTGATYPDSGPSGFPTVEVTGSALIATDFEASSSDGGLTFEGQAAATNTLDLTSLPNSGVIVSVPAQKVTWGSSTDLFSGISIVDGSASGNTSFLSGNTGGYEFEGFGSGNTLDLSGAASGVTASVATGTVTGLQGSGPTSGVDAFSHIASFVGSSSGSTTVAADSSDGLSFTGKGSGNTLDLSKVPATQPTPLKVNVSGAAVNTLANNKAAIGSTTFSFTDVTTFAGASGGWTTFYAGSSGGYTFDAAGGTAGNTLDLGAANSGLWVSVPNGTVGDLTTGTDSFSGIQTFNGPAGGDSVFDAGAADNETFNVPGNGNRMDGSSGTASFVASGNGNDFIAGTGDEEFSDSGLGNTLDFYEAAASQAAPLIVNLSGTTVDGVLNDNASNGSATYAFGGIQTFKGSSSGDTRFVPSSVSTGYTFDSNGGDDTLDLSSWPESMAGTVVDVPGGSAYQGGLSLDDHFVGITTFDGPTSGLTTFVADSTAGHTFNGSGSDNVLDLTDAGSGVTASVPNGTVTLGTSGLDRFSGISFYEGSSSGGTTLVAGSTGLEFDGQGSDNTLDLSHVPASDSTPLDVNVSGATVNSVANDTAAAGGATYTFGDVAHFTGSSSGHTDFVAGSAGGFTFEGVGGTAGNSLDLSAANTGLLVAVPQSKVTGLTTGTDDFSGIQTVIGSAGGGDLFAGGDADGLTFDAQGNGNTFVAGNGSATFQGGSGTGNALDFTDVSTSSQANLTVNLCGSLVGATANDTATVGTTTYSFSGNITTFQGSQSGHTRFIANGATGGFTFDGGSTDVLDLSFLPASGTTVSLPGETVSWETFQDTFSGITGFAGSTSGNTTFEADSTGGYTFSGDGSGNTLDLTAAGPNVTVSAQDGTATLASGSDSFSGIQTFVGSSSGNTDFIASGTTGGEAFNAGTGSGDTLDLSNLPYDGFATSVSAPAGVISWAEKPDSFSGITDVVGSGSGHTTFFTDSGGFTFTGGGTSGNELDLNGPAGESVSVPEGKVTGLTGGDVEFSDIQTFDGSAAGETTFIGGSGDGDTFAGGGNGNVFVAGSGSATFIGGGGTGTLDLSAVSTSQAAPLTVNLSGSAVDGTADDTATAGSTTYRFSAITNFEGAQSGNTRFIPSTTTGGYSIGFAGSGNTLDASFFPGSGTTFSTPAGTLTGNSIDDTFTSSGSSGFLTLQGSAAGNNDFVAGATGGYGFAGGGSGNVLDLSAAPAGAHVNVDGSSPAYSGTVTGLTSGTDRFSDIQSFTGPASVLFGLAVAKSGNGEGTVTSSPSGIDCGSSCSQGFTSGTSVTLTAAAAAGSTFTGWSGACSGTGNCTVTMNAGRSVTANFTLLPSYALTVAKTGDGTGTVTSSPSGIDCGSSCSQGFTSGTSVTLTAAPAPGSTFTGWSGACTGTANCSVTMSAARSVTANFTLPSYTLTVAKSGHGTVTSSPSGIDCGSTCSHGFTSGTGVTLTAAAATGWSFQKWTGACTGTGPCTLTVSGDVSITAIFVASSPPPPHCVVPDLNGKTLAAARHALRTHGCSLGKVSHVFSRTVKKDRVVSERPGPGRRLALGAKVSVVLSKGKRRKGSNG